jgi:membrane protease subunit HflK
MNIDPGRGSFVDSKGPWGPGESGGGGDEPPSGPWNEPAKPGRGSSPQSGNLSSFDDFLRRNRARWSPGGQFPGRPDGSFVLWTILGVLCLWIVFTSTHSIAPEQRGVVTRFGRYVYTLGPGVGMTLPSPLERVKKIDVESIRTSELGAGSGEDLMLTGDQNLINIDYSVRWNIRDPQLYLFELKDPEGTLKQAAESAMRAVISDVGLSDAMGDKRIEIENTVAQRTQQILDSYHSGIQVQGVAINQADPPQAVIDAFKDVQAAQQNAQGAINNANTYAAQLTAQAEGDAAAFDKIYAQYKLAPEVTRRRMYYETMEQVLSKVPKTIVESPGVMPYLPLKPSTESAQPQAQQDSGQ